MSQVLVIEDDPHIALFTARLLEELGHEVHGCVASAEEGLARARERVPDLVVTDIGLAGDMDGITATHIFVHELGVPVLIATANDDEATLRRVSALGSLGFLLKPFNKQQLRASVEVTLRSHRLQGSLRPAPPRPADPAFAALSAFEEPSRAATRTLFPTRRGKIIGSDPRFLDAFEVVRRVAPSDATVLVTGESGTGKELVAAALHEGSPRHRAPLIAINCGAIPEALLEGELFGHAKGAFTGAVAARQGLVAAAEGGTLLLDEIGEMPLLMQVRLLRLVQHREYIPLGSTKEVKCDVRIVAATNRDLEQEVAAGRFREDLFYRLNVVHVELPPLRERRGDIPALAEHFLRISLERAGRRDIDGFSEEAMAALVKHDWPGNIRSLQNVIERTVLLAPGSRIQLRDLPPQLRGEKSSSGRMVAFDESKLDLRQAVEDYQTALIREALRRTNNNKNRAAQLLGLKRTTLVEMMKRRKIV